ncbi:MAG: DUF3025 domain-containing protein [Pseudomonadota bacterium]
MSVPLEILEWQRPWLTPLEPILRTCLTGSLTQGVVRHDWRDRFNAMATEQGLSNHRGAPLHFVQQSALPPQVAYEAFISTTGGVPTRDNLHDFFNGLVWLTFPKSKAALNAIQAIEIERSVASPTAGAPSEPSPPRETNLLNSKHSNKSTRGMLRDRATIFDENGALVLTCDTALAQALVEHRWQEALLLRRADFGVVCEVTLFGHALMEKLVRPYKAITAHVWVLQVDRLFFDLTCQAKRQAIDTLLCRHLEQGMLAVPAAHLPVLGVPHWWKDQNEIFYADTSVFRPKRT